MNLLDPVHFPKVKQPRNRSGNPLEKTLIRSLKLAKGGVKCILAVRSHYPERGKHSVVYMAMNRQFPLIAVLSKRKSIKGEMPPFRPTQKDVIYGDVVTVSMPLPPCDLAEKVFGIRILISYQRDGAPIPTHYSPYDSDSDIVRPSEKDLKNKESGHLNLRP